MLAELWDAVRGHRVRAPSRDNHRAELPDQDARDLSDDSDDALPTYEAGPISGLACIITYLDSRGQTSSRRITCQRIEVAKSICYVRAFCHERSALRTFRVDRITEVADLHTGELSEAATFFAAFRIDVESEQGLHWGLSPGCRADLIAGLNVLIFMGRCDKEWHSLERDALERFVASFWLRHEIPHDPPLQQIAAHAERLVPDAETFFIALMRCAKSKVLSQSIRQHITAMIDADGVIAPEETYWGSQVGRFFDSPAP